jgi:hypothetical protein
MKREARDHAICDGLRDMVDNYKTNEEYHVAVKLREQREAKLVKYETEVILFDQAIAIKVAEKKASEYAPGSWISKHDANDDTTNRARQEQSLKRSMNMVTKINGQLGVR